MVMSRVELIDQIQQRLTLLQQVLQQEAHELDIRVAWDEVAQDILLLNDMLREQVGDPPRTGWDPLGGAGDLADPLRNALDQCQADLEVEMMQWMELIGRPRLRQLIHQVTRGDPPSPHGP